MSYQWKKVEERIYKINGLCKMTIRIPIEKKTHWCKIQFFVQKFNSNKNLEFMRENSNMSFLRIEF